MAKIKKDVNLNESNFQVFAQKAVEKYMDKGMMLDGMLWGQIIKYYNKAISKSREIIKDNSVLKDTINKQNEKINAFIADVEQREWKITKAINKMILYGREKTYRTRHTENLKKMLNDCKLCGKKVYITIEGFCPKCYYKKGIKTFENIGELTIQSREEEEKHG
jgi:dynactin complex subunit